MDNLRKYMSICLTILLLSSSHFTKSLLAWSNEGLSANPSDPDYGTHDWIAEHALDWLPSEEKQHIVDNLEAYLYGTELPDNSQTPDGIGDTALHHVYFYANGTMQDDSSAKRAEETYRQALDHLRGGDLLGAAKHSGTMTHYIADMAVFGHVMGAYTQWGPEKHHGIYESYVNTRTNDYEDYFNVFLSFDGVLDIVSAYDAATQLAYKTTFDTNGIRNASWMDQNYDWNDPAFKNRCDESLNLAVNYVTDVLHTLYLYAIDHKPKPTPTIMPSLTPAPQPTPTLPSMKPKWRDQYGVWVVLIIVTVIAAAILVYVKKRSSG